MAEDDQDLETLFDAARRTGATLPEPVMARILSDAAREQALLLRGTRMPGWRRQAFDLLGGWYGLSGLAATCAIGVWLGAVLPETYPDTAAAFLGTTGAVDVLASESLVFILSEER